MRLIFFLLILSPIISIHSQKKSILDKFKKKDKDILFLNAIVADKAYYSQAILEYKIVKKILEKHSTIDYVNKEINGTRLRQQKVSILENINQLESESLGIKPCSYKLPEKLEDLKSGFQFRHYLFKGENNTALQAFGIINNNFKKNDLFVVIDYIQYQDCGCDDLPKIRYAIGIRSEFKISGMSLNKNKAPDINNLNIEKLAANVEFDKLKVDISMKTIGITGKPARLNIPSNTSFNVQTYGEYIKVIDFIRNSLEKSKDNEIFIQPEIIPIMDEYRTSISDINTASFNEIIHIRKRYRRYNRKISKLKKDDITKSIDSILKESLIQEVRVKNRKREQLTKIDTYLKNLDKYVSILKFINTETNKPKDIIIQNKDTKTGNYKKMNKIYNDAISFIVNDNKNEAIKKLKEVREEKHNYGNAYEILKLLSNESDLTKIKLKIADDYSWLIDKDIINKLKQ